ncbi:MAG: hypothetical protein RLP44_12020 [Aggregatilineales bacterium]
MRIQDYDEITEDIVRQRNWTEDELKAQGYSYYERKKDVVLARKLPDSEAPKTIRTAQGDTLIAQEGYIICYSSSEGEFDSLEKFVQWPVEPSIFAKTYKRWDDPDWQPDPAQLKLIALGCKPYYKFVGVWVKKAKDDVLLQSLEHAEPVKVKTGQYIAIGSDGEPYSMGENTLHSRYKSSGWRVMSWMKRIFKG